MSSSEQYLPVFLEGWYQRLLCNDRIKLKKAHATWLEEVNNTKHVYENCISTGKYPISYLNSYINWGQI